MLSLNATHEQFALAQVFRIARGAKSCADVVTVTVSDGVHQGWGESVPYARYNESVESVMQQLSAIARQGLSLHQHQQLYSLLPAGSARNALDCALWDLTAKQSGTTVSTLLGLAPVSPCQTAKTISIDTPDNMALAAAKQQGAPLLKIKVGADDVIDIVQAIHDNCPHSQLIIDANEAWNSAILDRVLPALSNLRVALIEQPLPAADDSALVDFCSPIPLYADESCHTVANLAELTDRYQGVNIKLDKTGGLSGAMALYQAARQHQLGVMIGCMVGSSLAMAPAFLLAQQADFVDLDGPVLLAKDRTQGYVINNGWMSQPDDFLWGQPPFHALAPPV